MAPQGIARPARRPRPDAALRAALAGLLAAHALAGNTQEATVRPLQASIETNLIATDNGGSAPSGQERSDVFLSVRPKVRFERRSAGLSIVGDAQLGLFTSANGTRPSRVLPNAALRADATLVDQLLSLESSLDVVQAEIDPFASRVDPLSPQNSVTTSTVRVSPVLSRTLSPDLSIDARSDESWTRYSGPQGGDFQAHRAVAGLRKKPTPLGASIELYDERVNYSDASAAGWRTRSAVGTVSYAFGDEWVLGVLAGAERSHFELTAQTDTRAGIRAYWSPGPRTTLLASAERRYFGTGWELQARHRTPWTAISLRAVREPTTGNNTSGASSGSRLEEFLNAILTTRVPDPAQRTAEVQGLMEARALDNALTGSAIVTANYPQLRTGGNATWVLLSTRNALSLRLYAEQLTQLRRADEMALLQVPADADLRQYGAAVVFNRRLTAALNLATEAGWSRRSGLGSRIGEKTRESLYRLTFAQSLSPRTSASIGVQFRSLVNANSTVAGLDVKESTGFLGVAHRF